MSAIVDLPAVSGPLPWQREQWSHIQQRLEDEKLPHALLLAGVSHVGKTQFALALARLLLCHQPSAGHNCGSCQGCNLSRSGSHGDFRWLEPEGKAQIIKIDQIRQVVEFANMTAGFGKRKVVVLAPADAMNANAANAFLKSLEEPAANTFLILVCHRLHSLPATIRSRCQQFNLPLPDSAASLDWLDKLTGDRAESEQLLALSGGRPLLAQQWYREGGIEVAGAIPRALDALRDGQISAAELAVALDKLDIEEALEQLTSYLQRRLKSLDKPRLASPETRGLFALLDQIQDLNRAVAGGANPNKQLFLSSLAGRFETQLGMV